MKNKVFLFISVIVIIIAILNIIGKDNLKNISDEDKFELMKVLKIKNSSTFLPIEIKKVDYGFGDTTLGYKLKFEISIIDYNKNNLNYNDIETALTSQNYKEQKDEETYICYVKENEYNEYRKELFNELKKLYIKY